MTEKKAVIITASFIAFLLLVLWLNSTAEYMSNIVLRATKQNKSEIIIRWSDGDVWHAENDSRQAKFHREVNP